jgi:transposase-like protein
MKAENKIIKHKMSVLELAQTLGNISDACRRKGVSRTQFYEWKRRFRAARIGRFARFAADCEESILSRPRRR